ncbi:hypothetical protein [Flavobacterium sp.]|uniref:hypothetical protein n=1 Tax=Flavobacterium sp. TaxID=239 RepID=UPI0035B206B9
MKNYFLILVIIVSGKINAQTGIGTTTPHASAKLDVTATNKGFLPPRVTLTSATDAATIASPAEGLLVYNLGSVGLQAGYYYWNGSNWATIATAITAGIGVTAADLVKIYDGVGNATTINSTGATFSVTTSGKYLFDFSTSATCGNCTVTLNFQVRDGANGNAVIGSDMQTSYNNNIHAEYNGKVEVNLIAGRLYNVLVTASSGGIYNNDYTRVYMKQVAGNLPINQYNVGDIKTGLQTVDHNGWIKLDGRLKSTLTASQQTQANLLGIGTNLPDANNAVLMQTGSTLGNVAGENSKIIAQNNLPNVSFTGTAATAGDHFHSIDPPNTETAINGYHSHSIGRRSNSDSGAYDTNDGRRWENSASTTDRAYYGTFETAGAGNHSHSVDIAAFNSASSGSHSHTVTVSSGGSGVALDITPRRLSVNTFVYLGN